MQETYKVFKTAEATVRVHGQANLEAVKKAATQFLKGVEADKRKRG